MKRTVDINVFHVCGGLGGGAKGFNRARAAYGNLTARFRCIGSVDNDAAAVRDFESLTGTPGTLLDCFSREQYMAWHGHAPPPGWREATPADFHRAAGHQRPNIVFTSSPCKGFSGLQSEARASTAKYLALNDLALRTVWLSLEAWADDPPEFVLLENVPRIATRGRYLLDRLTGLLSRYGYAVAETTHDCGELGGMAQSRKRFLLVARHQDKVPPFLYEPRRRPLQSVGSVLGRMPLPGDIDRGGPMHRVPALQWKTWVRLAFVEAGSDWRSLNRLAVQDGVLRDYLIVPNHPHHGHLGVHPWESPSGTIQGASRPGNGAFSVADPRARAGAAQYQQYGVMRMADTSGAIIGVKSPGQGTFSVADPRHHGPAMYNHCFRVVPFGEAAGTVTAGGRPSSGGQAVSDPRPTGPIFGKYACAEWSHPTGTVIGKSTTGQGAFSVADPRPRAPRTKGDAYLTNGHYGVVPWDSHTGAISASARHDNGRWSVADPRLPGERDHLVCVITSLDGTWHRPFTTLELAALQSLIDPEETLVLDGLSDQAWRERIGNAVPPAAAEAIGEVMGRTLLAAWSGDTFLMDSTPIWVRPIATAIALPGAQSHG